MIKAVFFDFGGVIGAIDHEEMRQLELKHGLPDGGLWQAMYETEEWHALRIGHGSEVEWVKAIRETLDELAGRPIADSIAEEWVKCWRGLDHRVVGLARTLRERYRVGMISNATLTLEDELRDRHSIYDMFEIVVNSSRVGVAKPDARIYRHAAERIGLAPGACVHVDDLHQNVTGARDAGFHAVHYSGDYAALEAGLRELSLDW